MASVVDRIVVPFAGEGAGVGELSWGQLENWSAIVRQKTWIPLGGVKPLDASETVADIAAELAYLMGRYQSLRTRLRFDADGEPTQIVSSSGEITLEVVEAGEDDPAAVAESVRGRYETTDLDFTSEWPVRMAVVRQRGVLTHMVVLMSHFVTDAAGAVVLMTEVATRETAPVRGMAPLEQGQWQRTPAGRRQNAAALRYWEGVLRAVGPHRFVRPAEPVSPRYWLGEFSSPAMAPAVRVIAERTALESSAILLGIFAMALAPVTGINPVVVRPMVSNRFRSGLANVVCTAAQAGLCSLDVAGLTFDESLDRVRRAAMSAYKYGYFHPGDMVDLRERIHADRGTEIDLGCFFNDRRGAARQVEPGPPPTAEQARTLAADTTFRWVIAQDAPAFEQLFVHVEDTPDTITMTIQLDSHTLSPADGEAVLRGMEKVALDGAFGAVPAIA